MEREIVAKGVSSAEINRRIVEIWADPAFRDRLASQGLGVEGLGGSPPIEANPKGEQSGIAATILITVAGGLATHVAKKIFDAIWDELKRRYGARLSAPPDPQDR